MDNFYWNEDKMKIDGVTPTMLAIGDSWFWYLFKGGNLVNNIGDLVRSKGHIILAKGMNGAEASHYVDGKYARMVRTALKLYGSNLSAVFISGGGNDFAGFNDMRPMLKQSCIGETTAAGCFYMGEEGLGDFLKDIDRYYRDLIGLIYTHTNAAKKAKGGMPAQAACKIIMHTYAYAIPNGQGVFEGKGWLKPALDDAGVPLHLQQECVKYLLDQFYDVLDNIRKTDPDNLDIVDSRDALKPGDWANELHPSGDGFKKIATKAWRPMLKKHKLAD